MALTGVFSCYTSKGFVSMCRNTGRRYAEARLSVRHAHVYNLRDTPPNTLMQVVGIIKENGFAAPRFLEEFPKHAKVGLPYYDQVITHFTASTTRSIDRTVHTSATRGSAIRAPLARHVLQDILNVMSFDWPQRFFSMSTSWNYVVDRELATDWGDKTICVEHYTNRAFTDTGLRSGLFKYWRDYRRAVGLAGMKQREVRSKPPQSLRTGTGAK
jgi:hypothetical protein